MFHYFIQSQGGSALCNTKSCAIKIAQRQSDFGEVRVIQGNFMDGGINIITYGKVYEVLRLTKEDDLIGD